MVMTWYVLVQGTLILSASTEPVHFPMTDSEVCFNPDVDLIRNGRIGPCGSL